MLDGNIIDGLTKPVIKLMETISAGVGKLYEPIHIERMAKAKKTEIELISEAVTNNIASLVEYAGGYVTVDNKDILALEKRTKDRLYYQEVRKQQNIDAVVIGAYEEIKDYPTVSEEPVDEDWINRFFNSVGDVSNEELQKLWSKILAGEIKKPKTYSMRTLDILRSISTEEAIIFEKICKISWGKSARSILSSDKFIDNCGILYSNILRMGECGLLCTNPVEFYIRDNGNGTYLITRCKSSVLVIKKSTLGDIGIPVYAFTLAGVELSTLFDDHSDDNLLILYAKCIKDELGLAVSVHPFLSVDGDTVHYNEEINLLEQ